MRLVIWAAFLTTLGLFAQPVSAAPFIFYRGIVNSASFAPAGLPNGSIAQGSIFTIFGRELGPAEGVQVGAFPLRNELAGVSIEVCRGQDCSAAIPLFVRADQINAIMRSDAPLGKVSVRVTHSGESGNFSPATVTESSVGIFTVSSAGFGPGIAQNFVAPDNQPLNSLEAAATPGQAVTLWATGLGAGLNADNVAPEPGNVNNDVEILVGGKPAPKVLYSGRSPCCAGVDQIVFEIPPDAPSGCYVPVTVRTNQRVVGNSATLAISPDGSACSDPFNPLASLHTGGSIGAAFPIRLDLELPPAGELRLEYRFDLLTAAFDQQSSGPWRFHRLYSLPPVGACTAYAISGNLFTNGALELLLAPGNPLDAGDVVLNPSGILARPSDSGTGTYSAQAGLDLLVEPVEPLPLDGGGPFEVAGAGGADVGDLGVAVSAPLQIEWTNRAEVERFDPAAPLEMRWTILGGEPALVVVFGAASAIGRGASSLFLCSADPTGPSFVVPTDILSTTASGPLVVGVTAVSAPVEPFSASGLDSGLGATISMEARTLR